MKEYKSIKIEKNVLKQINKARLKLLTQNPDQKITNSDILQKALTHYLQGGE